MTRRILWHMPRLATRGCGMSRRACGLATGLNGRGHDVRWIVPADASPDAGVELDGIQVERIALPPVRPMHWTLQAQARMSRARALADQIDDGEALLISCQPEFIAAARQRWPGRPLVLVACCSQLLYEPLLRVENAARPAPTRWAYALDRELLRRGEARGFHAATAIAFDSEMTRELAVDHYALQGESCHVVRPTVDTNRFHPVGNECRAMLRRRLGLPDTGFIICWSGRMADRKNVELLLDAVAAARDCVASMLLVGDGPDRASLERYASNVGVAQLCQFVGMTNSVEPYLRAADLFVLPSLVESFGIALIEAMACGLPCIGLRRVDGRVHSAADESIVHGRSGYTLSSAEAGELASRIRELAHDPSRRARFGAAGRARAVSHFQAGRDVEELAHIIEECHAYA